MSLPNQCQDCNKAEATHTYGMGHKRCDSCSEVFDAKNRAERMARENAIHKCGDCNETYAGIYGCPHCCSHEFDPDEGYHCLNCGTDGAERVLSDMYDRAKDQRKYGDT